MFTDHYEQKETHGRMQLIPSLRKRRLKISRIAGIKEAKKMSKIAGMPAAMKRRRHQKPRRRKRFLLPRLHLLSLSHLQRLLQRLLPNPLQLSKNLQKKKRILMKIQVKKTAPTTQIQMKILQMRRS
jgi:hypothetical protein